MGNQLRQRLSVEVGQAPPNIDGIQTTAAQSTIRPEQPHLVLTQPLPWSLAHYKQEDLRKPEPGGQHGTSKTALDFSNPHLVPLRDPESIRDKWIGSWLVATSDFEQVPKSYNPFTVQFMARVLGTYPQRMVEDGGVPPFIHAMQIISRGGHHTISEALANCYSLVRMSNSRVPGSESMVAEAIQREMDRLQVCTLLLFLIQRCNLIIIATKLDNKRL